MMRPRNLSLAMRSITTNSVTMQTLCAMPASMSISIARGGPGICANTNSIVYQAGGGHDHRACRPDGSAVQDDGQRAQQGAGGETRDQISKPRLIDVIDVLGCIGQQPVRQGISRKVHQEGDRQRRQQLRRRPGIDEALLQLVPGRRPQEAAPGARGGRGRAMQRAGWLR